MQTANQHWYLGGEEKVRKRYLSESWAGNQGFNLSIFCDASLWVRDSNYKSILDFVTNMLWKIRLFENWYSSSMSSNLFFKKELEIFGRVSFRSLERLDWVANPSLRLFVKMAIRVGNVSEISRTANLFLIWLNHVWCGNLITILLIPSPGQIEGYNHLQ